MFLKSISSYNATNIPSNIVQLDRISSWYPSDTDGTYSWVPIVEEGDKDRRSVLVYAIYKNDRQILTIFFLLLFLRGEWEDDTSLDFYRVIILFFLKYRNTNHSLGNRQLLGYKRV